VCLSLWSLSFPVAAQTDHLAFIQNEKLTPPNCVVLREETFLDETEIANIHWLEFLHYAAKDSSREYYESMLPDTAAWTTAALPSIFIDHARKMNVDSSTSNRDFPSQYLRYPAYRYYPVVGISYAQATEFCKWRSEAVNVVVNKKLAESKKDYRVHYKYFLPTIEDLAFASRDSITKHQMKDKTVRVIRKLSPGYKEKTEFWNASVKQHIGVYKSGNEIYVESVNLLGSILENGNARHMYNLVGNVSEMTAEEGKSFGGAWIHSMDEIQNNKIFLYTKSEYWLGVRCACTVEIIRK
jgi:formylglycine-generating enzyme required for sulfatase activity